MELKKVNDDIFILGDRIDILKEHMTDGEYLDAMNSLSKLKNSFDSIKEFMTNIENFMATNHNFSYDITSNTLSVYMNSVNNYNYKKDQIRNLLTKKIRKFMIINSLPEDFMKSIFNLTDFICNLDYEILHKNYNIENNNIKCSCDNDNKINFCCSSVNDFLHCGHLQDIILQYPLLICISSDKPLDEIIQNILKYNMFKFDGSITNLDNYIVKNIEITHQDKEKYTTNINSLLTLLSFVKSESNCIKKIRDVKKIFIVLTIYKFICDNGVFIKTFSKFYKTIYFKLDELKKNGMRTFYYCFSRLNLDHKLFDIIENNLCEYVGYIPELTS